MNGNETWHGGRPRPGHIMLDGNPASPPQTRHSPQLSAHVCCGQTAGWIKKFKAPLGTDVDLGPDNIVLDGDQAPPTKKKSWGPQHPIPQILAHVLWPNGSMDQDGTLYGVSLSPSHRDAAPS